jgi:hypothetical protein
LFEIGVIFGRGEVECALEFELLYSDFKRGGLLARLAFRLAFGLFRNVFPRIVAAGIS